MKFSITSRFAGSVLFELETDSLKLCVEAAVKAGADLRDADLAGAYLRGANLAGAYLRDANLRDANLAGAYLRGANLAGAYLRGAYLRGAYLSDANLRGANLRGADLRDANLSDADLRGADLRGAYLRDANLRGADLRDANLSGADLRGAYLSDANLSDADLRGADLRDAKQNPATPEEIARLDEVREIVLAKPERLKMETWHSGQWNPDHTPQEEHTCGSAHCIAGWLQALSPDPAMRKLEPSFAGWKLAPIAAPMFYTDDATALEWLTNRDYAKVSE